MQSSSVLSPRAGSAPAPRCFPAGLAPSYVVELAPLLVAEGSQSLQRPGEVPRACRTTPISPRVAGPTPPGSGAPARREPLGSISGQSTAANEGVGPFQGCSRPSGRCAPGAGARTRLRSALMSIPCSRSSHSSISARPGLGGEARNGRPRAAVSCEAGVTQPGGATSSAAPKARNPTRTGCTVPRISTPRSTVPRRSARSSVSRRKPSSRDQSPT